MEKENYKFPSKELLSKSDVQNEIEKDIDKEKIEKFFQQFKIDIECKEVNIGINSITYIIDLKCKTKVSKIKSYKEDLMLQFNVINVEFEVAINGTSYLGIHLIKENKNVLMLGDILESKEFDETVQKVPIILGRDFNGKNIIEDLTELPHLLIAGTTGTGKSNFLSTVIVDILYKLTPDEVKIVLVDTRATNFLRFEGIHHLLIPVVTESQETLGILMYLIEEMNNRYILFQKNHVNNIDAYNKIYEQKLPRIIVIIEDFYDLMIETNKSVETYIKELVQMSRAAGIHVIISTQRPSADVITGVVKANMPSRMAFKVPSQVDSKTIIDVAGAEKLSECGETIFRKIGEYKNKRIQTPYINDEDIEKIIKQIKMKSEHSYSWDILEAIYRNNEKLNNPNYNIEYEKDVLLQEAIESVIQSGQASTSFIQRKFNINYARADRIIDQMEERGIISGYQGSKPRKILMTMKKWNKLKCN